VAETSFGPNWRLREAFAPPVSRRDFPISGIFGAADRRLVRRRARLVRIHLWVEQDGHGSAQNCAASIGARIAPSLQNRLIDEGVLTDPEHLLLPAPFVRQGAGERGSGQVLADRAIGDRRDDARRQIGERDQEANMPLGKSFG